MAHGLQEIGKALLEDIIDNSFDADSKEIAKYINSKKLCKCIMRTEGLSGDAEVFEVYQDAWNLCGQKHDYIIGLQPDNPDRKLILDDVIDYVNENNLDDFFTVGENGKKNGAIRMFKKNIDSIDNPKVNTLLENCTNIHNKSDLSIAASRIIINSNPLDLTIPS